MRCRRISLLAMGAFVMSTAFIFPATLGRASELSAPAQPLLQMVGHSQTSAQAQSSHPLYFATSALSQTDNGAGETLTSGVASAAQDSPSSSESPAVQAPPVVQAPLAAQQLAGSQDTSPPPPTLADGQDTFVGVNGPFVASIAWGDGMATAPNGAENLSATLNIGAATDIHASGYWMKVDWGDGQVVTEVLGKNVMNKTLHVTGTHIYHASGTFPINLTISDNNGSQMTATRHVIVHSVVVP